MRKLGIVALGAAAALTLAGCASGGAGGSEEGAEIRVWLVGTDTPDEAREYLVDTFEEEHPGSTLVIEEQSWDGLVDRLTTSLSGSDSPDVVVDTGLGARRGETVVDRSRVSTSPTAVEVAETVDSRAAVEFLVSRLAGLD